jgi:hypothetical protein
MSNIVLKLDYRELFSKPLWDIETSVCALIGVPFPCYGFRPVGEIVLSDRIEREIKKAIKNGDLIADKTIEHPKNVIDEEKLQFYKEHNIYTSSEIAEIEKQANEPAEVELHFYPYNVIRWAKSIIDLPKPVSDWYESQKPQGEPPVTQSSELKPLDDNPLHHKERRSYLRVIASLMATIRSKPFDIHNTSAVALLEEMTKENNYSISNDTARKIINLLKNLEPDN